MSERNIYNNIEESNPANYMKESSDSNIRGSRFRKKQAADQVDSALKPQQVSLGSS